MYQPTLLLSAALIAALSSVAVAGTIVVPKDHTTIQAAVDAAGDGDTIIVKKGTYDETVVIDGNAGKNGLTIKGIGKPIVDGGGTGDCLTITNADGIVVTGMSFTNARVNGVLVRGSSDVEISKCSAYDNSCEDRALGAGMRVETSSGVTIAKSKFSGNCVFAIYLFDPTGTALSSCTLERNKITDSQEGISVQGTGHVVMKNSIVGAEGIALFLDDESSNVRFEKNSVKNSEFDALVAGGGSGHTFLNNKYVKTQACGATVQGENITVEGDKIIKSSDTGLVFRANNSVARKVKVIGSGEHGIDVRGMDSLIEECTVIRTKSDAFKGRGTGNTLRNNTAKKTRARDLDATLGDPPNVYEGNKFDASKVSPEGLEF